MKTLNTLLTTILFVFAVQVVAVAQSSNVAETFKKHINETVQEVQNTDNADEKRVILNESFTSMIAAIDRIESLASLTEDESAILENYKLGIEEKLSELNGLDGFDDMSDEELDEFSDYSQDFIEQANRTVTIGITTALLILIILLLL